MRVRPKHSPFVGDGWWGTVDERQGRTRSLVVQDGYTKRCQVFDGDVVEIVKAHCIYCRGDGFHGDEFTGGECYCNCAAGVALKRSESQASLSESAGDT